MNLTHPLCHDVLMLSKFFVHLCTINVHVVRIVQKILWTYHEISSRSNRHGTTQGIKNPKKKWSMAHHGHVDERVEMGTRAHPSQIWFVLARLRIPTGHGRRQSTHPNRPRYGSTGKWGISGFGTLKHQPTWWFQLFSWQDYRIATPPAHKKSCCLMKQNIYTKRCLMDILISSLICSLFPHHWGAEKPL